MVIIALKYEAENRKLRLYMFPIIITKFITQNFPLRPRGCECNDKKR